jgi:hypothetical protein
MAELRDPRTGAVTELALGQPRAWHTSTVLPDGRVLILGGVGADGAAVGAPERFDPETGRFEPLGLPGLIPRSHHTATLLTDGRVLIAGGRDQSGQTLGAAQVWDWSGGAVETLAAPMGTPRSGHGATLQADGSVLLWGGQDATGLALSGGERFDPATAGFAAVATSPLASDAGLAPELTASIPAADASKIPVDSLVALRFSRALSPESLSTTAVTLSGPGGPESIRLVIAEGERLLFLTPVAPLQPGATYTVAINGAVDSQGLLLPFITIGFTTQGAAAPSGAAGATAGPTDHSHDQHAHHNSTAPLSPPGRPARLDAAQWKGERRGGTPYSRWQDLPPLRAPHGVTALAGQVLDLDGEPLADVTLQIGARAVRSDRTGRFLLTGIPAGWHALIMDGASASRPGETYATCEYGVEIRANETTVLPFTIWLPLIDTEHATPLPVPTQQPVIATSPRIPGLEVHVPAGVILRARHGTAEGHPLTALSLTQIPVDRPPFPLPEGTSFFFTPQGHGALVERPDGSPSPVGVRVVLPNPDRLPPGTRVGFQTYAVERGGWYTYGFGTVSADGSQIVPDPGVELQRLTCAYVFATFNFLGKILGGLPLGDPVDAATGLFTMEKVDLVLPDTIPIMISRHYLQNAPPGTFGYGMNLPYDLVLAGDGQTYQWVELVLAEGAKVRFTRTSPGTDRDGAVMEHTQSPTRFHKAKLTWNLARSGWERDPPRRHPLPVPGGRRPRAPPGRHPRPLRQPALHRPHWPQCRADLPHHLALGPLGRFHLQRQ